MTVSRKTQARPAVWSRGAEGWIRIAATCAMLAPLIAPNGLAAGEPAQRRYVCTERGEKPQPTVAVDNVCAWPNLTMLRDGTITAVIFNQPNHACMVGDVECWASADQGRTWEKRGVPAAHDPPSSNRMNVAAGLANNGDLLVISSGWLLETPRRPPPGTLPGFAGLVRILDPWVCRSSDGGRTWAVDKRAFPAASPAGKPCVPFGDIHSGADRRLRVAVYSRLDPPPDRKKLRVRQAYVYRSDDDGRSWGDPVALDPTTSRSETAVFPLGAGHWLAAARGADGDLGLYASQDDARSWRFREQVGMPGQHPGHLLRLRDGRLLLAYGNRSATPGVEIRYGDAEGRTWSPPLRVVDWLAKPPIGNPYEHARHGDGGYPSNVQLPDGRIVTAYYASAIEGHPRYHMGVVLWDPQKSQPGPQ